AAATRPRGPGHTRAARAPAARRPGAARGAAAPGGPARCAPPRRLPATSAFRWVFARRTSRRADQDGKGKQADEGVTTHGASAWFWWAHSAQPARSGPPSTRSVERATWEDRHCSAHEAAAGL